MVEWFIRGRAFEAWTREQASPLKLNRAFYTFASFFIPMESFSVELEQPQGVFLPGQNVNGLIQFKTTAAESFKGIFLLLKEK